MRELVYKYIRDWHGSRYSRSVARTERVLICRAGYLALGFVICLLSEYQAGWRSIGNWQG